MSNDTRKNNNDLTTGDLLYDLGIGTSGEPAGSAPEADDPKAAAIERNFSTYAGQAATEAADKAGSEEV